MNRRCWVLPACLPKHGSVRHGFHIWSAASPCSSSGTQPNQQRQRSRHHGFQHKRRGSLRAACAASVRRQRMNTVLQFMHARLGSTHRASGSGARRGNQRTDIERTVSALSRGFAHGTAAQSSTRRRSRQAAAGASRQHHADIARVRLRTCGPGIRRVLRGAIQTRRHWRGTGPCLIDWSQATSAAARCPEAMPDRRTPHRFGLAHSRRSRQEKRPES